MEHSLVIIQIAIGIILVLFGWTLKSLWSSIHALQDSDDLHSKDISALKVKVAERYVTRDEFNHTINRMFEKLDVIQDSVGRKADR